MKFHELILQSDNICLILGPTNQISGTYCSERCFGATGLDHVQKTSPESTNHPQAPSTECQKAEE